MWIALVAVTALLILAASHSLPVDYDEAYYWTWSQAPAFSYLDHPPGVAWALAASTALFGDGKLGLRLPALFASFVTAILSVASTRRLVPDADALVLLGLFGALMFSVGYLPTTPDPLQGAAIALAAYVSLRALEPEASPRWAVALPVTFAVAVLFKHSSVLIAVGVSSVVLFRARHLLRPLALGVVAAALLLAPFLAADLGDGSWAFQATRVLTSRATRGPVAIPLLLGAIALTFGPGAASMLLAQIWASLRGRTSAAESALGLGALGLLLGCGVAAWLGVGEINWPMPAWVYALPAVVAFTIRGAPGLRRWYTGASLVALAASWLVLAHVITPFLPLRADKDRTLRAAGFDRVAERAESIAAEHGADLIITRRYQPAAMLRYYTRDRRPVLELGTARKSQFDRWPRPSACVGQFAVLVLNVPELPPELVPISVALATPEEIARGRGAGVVDRWYVTPIRMTLERPAELPCGVAPR